MRKNTQSVQQISKLTKDSQKESVKPAKKQVLKQSNDKIDEVIQEKEKLALVISSLINGLIILDQHGKITMVNPQAEKYFDIKEENILGEDITKIGFINEIVDLFKEIKINRRAITKEIAFVSRASKGADLTSPKTSVQQKTPSDAIEEHEKEFFNITAKIITDSHSKVMGYILIAHNITREKTIERLKNEFISISAHQLRTPLSAIKWTLQMILTGSMGKVEGEVRDYIAKAYESNERMIILVNDLLNVSRIEEGRFLDKLESVTPQDVIKEVISGTTSLALKKKVQVKVNITGSIPQIKADYKKLKLAIQNLVDNAIKYSISGSQVNINLKKTKKNKENYILVEVKDSGIGLSKRDQQRLFVKFFRGANAIRMQTEGSGLGLFIVKNIIEAHGGKIWFKSQENKGSTFSFILPIK